MLKEASIGAVIGFVGILCLAHCASSTVAQCQLTAVSALPLDDPDSITVGEARALAIRLKECVAQDAGP